MKEYKYSIFIGRFQPIHSAHLEMITEGLNIAEKMIIIIGSAKQARNIKNPFTFEERQTMILNALSEQQKEKIIIRGMKDFFYNDNIWTTNVQKIIKEITKDESRIVMIGSYKDANSYWLNCFPQYDLHTVRCKNNIDASSIRNLYFSENKPLFENEWSNKNVNISNIADSTKQFLKDFSATKTYENLTEEFRYINNYKKSWDKAPFAPVFVTTDCVVVCMGHVLTIQRGFNPGKGLYALPGGFLNQEEKIEDGAIRELKEETGIRIPKPALKNCIVDSKIFDYPARSLRGRTITHAFHLKVDLIESEMPSVKSGSDANEVRWMEFSEIAEKQDMFFEDHFHIINSFLYKQ